MLWTIKLYTRKKYPDLKSRLVLVGRKRIPRDTVPIRIADLKIRSSSKDGARAEAKRQLAKRGFDVASVNFSADNPRTIIVHVFEDKMGKMRKATQ